MRNGIKIELLTSEENVNKFRAVCSKQMIAQENEDISETELDAPIISMLKEILSDTNEVPKIIAVSSFYTEKKSEQESQNAAFKYIIDSLKSKHDELPS